MTINYKSTANGDLYPYKTVHVTQVDLNKLEATVQDKASAAVFMVSMRSAVGYFFFNPAIGEEWVVKRQGAIWLFDRRTTVQNPAITALRASSPGDVILATPGNFIVTAPLVQANITNRWIVPSFTVTSEIAAEPTSITVNANSIATVVSSNRLKILKTGTYAISFYALANSATTTRAAIRFDVNTSGNYMRRSNFPGETIGQVEGTVPLAKDDEVFFRVYHTSGADRTFTGNIEITRVR